MASPKPQNVLRGVQYPSGALVATSPKAWNRRWHKCYPSGTSGSSAASAGVWQASPAAAAAAHGTPGQAAAAHGTSRQETAAQQHMQPCPLPADYKQRVARQFDKRAAQYDEGNVYHPPLAAHLVDLAALQPGAAVLDVGTGTGLVALLAAQAVGSCGRVTGVDVSDAMAHTAATKARAAGLHNAVFLAADIEECAFSSDKFDAILCSSTLPFLLDIPARLEEWHAWLKPGGRLAFNVPKGVGSQAFTVFSRLAAQRGLLLPDPSHQFGDEGQVRQMLAAAGFSAAGIQLAVSQEMNLRKGQSAEQWAEAGWALCLNMPFANLPALLGAEEVESMRQQYLEQAAELARGFATSAGVAEPYGMLWVLACK